MKVVVDANIIFSGILNSNGKIGDLLINSHKHINFIAPEFLRFETSMTSTLTHTFMTEFGCSI